MTQGRQSHYRIGSVIDPITCLVIDYAVLSLYCHGCSTVRDHVDRDSDEYWEWKTAHECNKNFHSITKKCNGCCNCRDIVASLWAETWVPLCRSCQMVTRRHITISLTSTSTETTARWRKKNVSTMCQRDLQLQWYLSSMAPQMSGYRHFSKVPIVFQRICRLDQRTHSELGPLFLLFQSHHFFSLQNKKCYCCTVSDMF